MVRDFFSPQKANMGSDNDLWRTNNYKSSFGDTHSSNSYSLDIMKKSYFFQFVFLIIHSRPTLF